MAFIPPSSSFRALRFLRKPAATYPGPTPLNRSISRTATTSSSSTSPPTPTPSTLLQTLWKPSRTLFHPPLRKPLSPSRHFHNRQPSKFPPRQQSQPQPHDTIPQSPPLSLSQRLKKLSKEYGYAAVAVYLGLSALDFPFCFLAVRYLGTEKIGLWEEKIIATTKSILPDWMKSTPERERIELEIEQDPEFATLSPPSPSLSASEKKDASIWTELALAYAIHKSFIFIRVPLTAAVTPKVVKVLRKWGWDIGKKRSA